MSEFSPLTLAFLQSHQDDAKKALLSQPDKDGYIVFPGSKGQPVYAPESGVLTVGATEIEIRASDGPGEERDWHLGPVLLDKSFPQKTGATVTAGSLIGTLTDDLKIALWAEQGGGPLHPISILGDLKEDLRFVDSDLALSPSGQLETPPPPNGGPSRRAPGCWTGTEVALTAGASVLGWELVKRMIWGRRR